MSAIASPRPTRAPKPQPNRRDILDSPASYSSLYSASATDPASAILFDSLLIDSDKSTLALLNPGTAARASLSSEIAAYSSVSSADVASNSAILAAASASSLSQFGSPSSLDPSASTTSPYSSSFTPTGAGALPSITVGPTPSSGPNVAAIAGGAAGGAVAAVLICLIIFLLVRRHKKKGINWEKERWTDTRGYPHGQFGAGGRGSQIQVASGQPAVYSGYQHQSQDHSQHKSVHGSQHDSIHGSQQNPIHGNRSSASVSLSHHPSREFNHSLSLHPSREQQYHIAATVPPSISPQHQQRHSDAKMQTTVAQPRDSSHDLRGWANANSGMVSHQAAAFGPSPSLSGVLTNQYAHHYSPQGSQQQNTSSNSAWGTNEKAQSSQTSMNYDQNFTNERARASQNSVNYDQQARSSQNSMIYDQDAKNEKARISQNSFNYDQKPIPAFHRHYETPPAMTYRYFNEMNRDRKDPRGPGYVESASHTLAGSSSGDGGLRVRN